jgi:hypothetical protein
MGASGVDVLLSNRAIELFPFAIECKRHAKFAVYSLFEQAIANKKEQYPMLVIQQDRSVPLVVLTLEDFLNFYENRKSN